MSITQSDIAKETGFSINTVSRALRGDPKISESTTEIICDTAEKLHYIPNALASSMRSEKSGTIGVITADSSNPFFAELFKGAESVARAKGYHILMASTEESALKEKEILTDFLSRKIDGLFSTPVYFNNPEHLNFYRTLPIPFIFAGRRLEGLENHSITTDDFNAQKEVIRTLLARHDKILYLAGPDTVSNSSDRLNGYITAHKEMGKPYSPERVLYTRGRIENGYIEVNRALNQGIEFTAIACFNDLVALGALKSLRENGLNCPPVEVFGFDNLYLSQFITPTLSSVDVPKFRIGQLAMESLIEHIRDPEKPYKEKIVPTRSVFRETTVGR